eukprot:COSAG01_NODE_22930_length_835_cov_1.816576_2_plen_92_part_00
MAGSAAAVVPVVLLAIVVGSPSFVATAPVTSLPGWNGPLPSKQDAGHITVDDALGTSYFYCAAQHRPICRRSPPVSCLPVFLPGGCPLMRW